MIFGNSNLTPTGVTPRLSVQKVMSSCFFKSACKVEKVFSDTGQRVEISVWTKP